MKAILITICLFSITLFSFSQGDFNKQIATAKTSYAAGKLEDAHFALQQALQELDLIIGKEVLKMMPMKLDTLNVNSREDHVTANSGFIGTTIHRSYGAKGKASVEIISNSPMISSLNAFLNMPMLGGMMRDEKTKVVKVQGYKSRLEKQNDNADGKPSYDLQIPFNGALMTFKTSGMDEEEVLRLVNTFPLQDIAKLIQ